MWVDSHCSAIGQGPRSFNGPLRQLRKSCRAQGLARVLPDSSSQARAWRSVSGDRESTRSGSARTDNQKRRSSTCPWRYARTPALRSRSISESVASRTALRRYAAVDLDEERVPVCCPDPLRLATPRDLTAAAFFVADLRKQMLDDGHGSGGRCASGYAGPRSMRESVPG